jgi:hypothetical protein
VRATLALACPTGIPGRSMNSETALAERSSLIGLKLFLNPSLDSGLRYRMLRVIASTRLPEGFRSAMNSVPCSRMFQVTDRKGSIELNNWVDALRAIARDYNFGCTWTEPMVSSANELLGTLVLNCSAMVPLKLSQSRILREAARLEALAIEHRGAYERLLHQGYHDALTGLPNRLLLADRLKQALARAERTKAMWHSSPSTSIGSRISMTP